MTCAICGAAFDALWPAHRSRTCPAHRGQRIPEHLQVKLPKRRHDPTPVVVDWTGCDNLATGMVHAGRSGALRYLPCHLLPEAPSRGS